MVVGAGLAGACAALHLRQHGTVCVLERDDPASGASGVAVGLVNPILGRRARPVWRIEEAPAALEETLSLANAEDAFVRRPTLRPAGDAEQVERFRRSAAEYPEHCTWLDASPFDWLHAPRGILRIETGGAIDIERLVRAGLEGIEVRRENVEGWTERPEAVEAAGISARFLILALGRGYTGFAELMQLRLHQVKGQVIRLARPADVPADAPHVTGSGYAAAEAGASTRSLTCGSTYEHVFEDLEPTGEASREIRAKVERMVPSLRDAALIEARAGVRVTVPGIRLPMVGPLPGRRRVWIFSGLGAKGLLTAPLVAKELAGYLDDPERIPKETRVRVA